LCVSAREFSAFALIQFQQAAIASTAGMAMFDFRVMDLADVDVKDLAPRRWD